MKVSASDERRFSVPSRGLRRSVFGRFVKSCVKVGRVRVERICMYSASSWDRSWESLSLRRLMATKYKGP